MKLWIVGTDLAFAERAMKLGIAEGVVGLAADVEVLLALQEGTVAAAVEGTDLKEILFEAQTLVDISERVVVQIPFDRAGLEAVRTLFRKKILVMVTEVINPQQAWLAALAGAEAVLFDLSTLKDPWKILKEAVQLVTGHHVTIFASGFQSLDDLIPAQQAGVQTAIFNASLFETLIPSDDSTRRFQLAAR